MVYEKYYEYEISYYDRYNSDYYKPNNTCKGGSVYLTFSNNVIMTNNNFKDNYADF